MFLLLFKESDEMFFLKVFPGLLIADILKFTLLDHFDELVTLNFDRFWIWIYIIIIKAIIIDKFSLSWIKISISNDSLLSYQSNSNISFLLDGITSASIING